MNKKILTAIMILCCTLLCTMPFSVKAYTYVNNASSGVISVNNNAIGGYQTLTYTKDAGDTELDLSTLGLNSNTYTAGSVTFVGFNAPYTGVITFKFQNLSYQQSRWVEGDGIGQVSYDSSNNTITIHMVNCINFEIYMFTYSVQAYTAQVQSYSDINLVMNDYGLQQDYQIPIESVPAYIFTTNNPNDIIYNLGDAYPHYHVLSGTIGQTVRFYALDRNQHCYYVFFTKDTITNQRTLTLNRNNTVSMTVGAINPYTASSYRLYLAEFTVPSDSALNEIRWGFETDVYPVFFGYYSQMPDTIRQMCGLSTTQGEILDALRNQNITLTQIYNLLFNTTDTSQSIQDTADAVDDLIDEEHDITDGFLDDLTGFNTDMDLTQYNFTSLFMDANNYFKNQLDTMYTESSGFQGYWVIPIILIILTVLLGK